MNTKTLGNVLDIDSTAALLGVESEELRGGLNLVEAARVLGIAPSTLRQRALRGRIGHQRDGRRWLFYWHHLADYIKAREHPIAGSVETQKSAVARPLHRSPAADVEAEARTLGLV